ncbi:MAG: ATP-binding protein [Reyranella sp.]|jgi:hypothetical protein|nr:ATP-binding protein [Reyranella sp.]
MKGSIVGRVRNTTLPRAKALLPLFEAVMNAFQAIEEGGGGTHSIRIRVERQGDLANEKTGDIEAFTVTDTGCGFTDANYSSFDTIDSSYKAHRGGKGLGRFVWLKAFQRVEIDSHFRQLDGSTLARRTFAFLNSDDEQPCTPIPSDQQAPITVVRLIGFREPYRSECPKNLATIAQRVVGHFLPLFLDPKGPEFSLSDSFEEINLRDFYRTNFE